MVAEVMAVVGDVEALAVVMPDSLAATPVASAVMWVMVLSAVGTFPVARTVSQPYTATQVLVAGSILLRELSLAVLSCTMASTVDRKSTRLNSSHVRISY